MESVDNRIALDPEDQVRILTRLTDAVLFEEFVQRKFVGAKSFSLEGAESLVPLLDLAIERAAEQGVEEIVIGMAHRGRLNVLANILGKRPSRIFREFEDRDGVRHIGAGDVKVHQGFHGDWKTRRGRTVHLALAFNPSHLEFVDPVVLGRVRAKQDRVGDRDGTQTLPLLIHGDAAFAGEGIVQETLNLAALEPYAVGGTLHVVVNNRIGFTTEPAQARSCRYATDAVKLLPVPIFHVNGEDPEAVAQAVYLALEFRRRFRRDAVIDMFCYRRRGHNESDEPAFTQPLRVREIRRRPPVRRAYLDRLLRLGTLDPARAEAIERSRREFLEREFEASVGEPDDFQPARPSVLGRVWRSYTGGPEANAPDVPTAVDRTRLAALLEALARVPADFRPHEKLARLLDLRREMAAGGRPLDWAAGEALAFATLAVEGVRGRMTGQDCERGTFSHRHAVLHDVETGDTHEPLGHLTPDQGPVAIRNSPLSEAGVLGFEYGYAAAYPEALVLWEAQFGDFANVAQVIIDQFLASAEDKWNSLCGLVLLLPHGFEGMGPEHSSARIERFLMLAAEDNLQIAQPTTPAQIFHLLRRQVLRPWRKPLVVFTPKGLLRHPAAVSTLDDLAHGSFRRVLPDPAVPPAEADRVILCSGRVYYDLRAAREARGGHRAALVRIEQFYPQFERTVAEALAPYPGTVPVRWVQDEPSNMGPLPFLLARRERTELAGRPFRFASRAESASPATGSAAGHRLEQQALMDEAFAD
jgi:2-oxoglutarate dehydrogenase E1 component